MKKRAKNKKLQWLPSQANCDLIYKAISEKVLEIYVRDNECATHEYYRGVDDLLREIYILLKRRAK